MGLLLRARGIDLIRNAPEDDCGRNVGCAGGMGYGPYAIPLIHRFTALESGRRDQWRTARCRGGGGYKRLFSVARPPVAQ